MSDTSGLRGLGRWFAAGLGFAVGGYAVYVGTAWCRFGRVRPARGRERDALLDRFMPVYEVVERHHVRVDAPAAHTFAAACEMDLQASPAVRAIFKAREWLLHSHPSASPSPRGLIPQMKAIGWGVLAENPGQEIVMGAVTEPWNADVVFRALPPDEFAAFHKPGFVKIVWTLRADADEAGHSVFRTETRAVATDAESRAKFRTYWALASPGIILIRWLSLGPFKAAAERGVGDTTTGAGEPQPIAEAPRTSAVT